MKLFQRSRFLLLLELAEDGLNKEGHGGCRGGRVHDAGHVVAVLVGEVGAGAWSWGGLRGFICFLSLPLGVSLVSFFFLLWIWVWTSVLCVFCTRTLTVFPLWMITEAVHTFPLPLLSVPELSLLSSLFASILVSIVSFDDALKLLVIVEAGQECVEWFTSLRLRVVLMVGLFGNVVVDDGRLGVVKDLLLQRLVLLVKLQTFNDDLIVNVVEVGGCEQDN